MDIEETTLSPSRAPVWVCPECGARLVTKNLWHSCGKFAIDDLFAKSPRDVLKRAQRFVEMLNSLGDVQVLPQKTRLTCVARVRFGGFYPRKNDFVVSFALQRWLQSPRILKRIDYGPRWRMHFVLVKSDADLDDELRAWLQESHDVVGMQRDSGSPPGSD